MSQRWNVLIADGDRSFASTLVDHLKSLKAKARVAANGQEAILFTGVRAPDLIVAEVELPMLNGLEATRFLKSKFAERTVPSLILTTKSDAATREECGLIGCEDLIVKPAAIEEILASAESLLELGRSENELVDLERRRASAKKGLPPEEDNRDELVSAICQLRADITKRLLERGYRELTQLHVDRIARLDPEHPSLSSLRAQSR